MHAIINPHPRTKEILCTQIPSVIPAISIASITPDSSSLSSSPATSCPYICMNACTTSGLWDSAQDICSRWRIGSLWGRFTIRGVSRQMFVRQDQYFLGLSFILLSWVIQVLITIPFSISSLLSPFLILSFFRCRPSLIVPSSCTSRIKRTLWSLPLETGSHCFVKFTIRVRSSYARANDRRRRPRRHSSLRPSFSITVFPVRWSVVRYGLGGFP